MRRDQKKTTNRKTPTKTRTTKQTAFDKGGRLDSKYKQFKKTPKRGSGKLLKDLGKILTIAILISVFVGSIFVYLRISDYDSQLLQNVANLDDTNCRDFNAEKIESILLLTLDSKTKLVKAELNLFIPTESKYYGFDFTDYEFLIDRAATTGTLQKYIEINNVFLDKKSIFKYLSNLFYREFLIKVDKVVVQNPNGGLKEYTELYNADYYSKLNPVSDFGKNIQIETDICRNSWNEFINTYKKTSKSPEIQKFNTNSNVTDVYTFNSIKKEQLRVQINNLTGLERVGGDFSRMLTSYGLNVVKVDYQRRSEKKTIIYIDRDNIKSSQTILVLKYLMENQISNPEIKIQNNIFADIYIDLGEDMIVQ